MYSLREHLRSPVVLTESKNLHLEHIEDEILNGGLAGGHIAINFLEGIRAQLAGQGTKSISVTTKWDGSPAIVCGKDPETGNFFVGTKSVFNKRTPKVCFSEDDIHRHYKEQPDLAEKLVLAFRYLDDIGIEDVLQGDLMFTNKDVKQKTIDGQEYVTFQPNTITYAVPTDGVMAERIRRAKIGVIFHTAYSGDKIKTLKPSYDVNLEELEQNANVWFDDASYKDETGTVTLTKDELQTITRHLDAATEALGKLDPLRFEQLLTSKNLIGMIKMYTNSRIRSGKQYDGSYLKDLQDYINDRIQSETTKDAKKEEKTANYELQLKQMTPVIGRVVEFQHHINEAKLLILKKLHQIGSVDAFIQSEDGFKATKQEGFVAVDHLTNKAIKLVDRLEFSKNNFGRFSK